MGEVKTVLQPVMEKLDDTSFGEGDKAAPEKNTLQHLMVQALAGKEGIGLSAHQSSGQF